MNDRLRRIREKAHIRRIAKRKIALCVLAIFLLVGIGIAATFQLGAKRSMETAFKTAPSKTETDTSSPAKTETVQTETKPESSETEITVSLMGDCTLGTDMNFNWNTSLNAYFEYQGADYFFKNVKSILEADDLSIVNMEGTLTTSDQRVENLFAFKGDADYVNILTSGSVEAANMANNHSHDYGEQGFSDTLNTLKSAGITTFGYDETAVIDVKGIKIGLVGIYELYDHLERTSQLLDNMEKVKEEGAQITIVVFHWGNEKETQPDSNQTTLGHLAIDNGADLVVGHHSHVLQPIEKYKGKYIAYSLGNFCFGGNSNPSDKDTIIFQQTFTWKDGILKDDGNINIIPCRISSDSSYNNYQPTPVTGEDAKRIYEKLEYETGDTQF